MTSMLRIIPLPEKRSQVLAILRSVRGPTQVKPHCLSCRLYVEDDVESALLYTEEWDSEPDFRAHLRSEFYRRILAAMDLSKSAPELRFQEVGVTHGLELVQELLQGDGTGSTPARGRWDLPKPIQDTQQR